MRIGATRQAQPGLGQLLRHLTDLLDRGSQEHYQAIGLQFRPRYTPIMRALGDGPLTISGLQRRARITQGAVSQTVKLMQADGLIRREPGADGRSQQIMLTPQGRALHRKLVDQWMLRFTAIEQLEHEIRAPLRDVLTSAIDALERDDFHTRLTRTEPPRVD